MSLLVTPPTKRHASIQAWRRLRRAMTDTELRNMAVDIADIVGDPKAAHSIAYALIYAPWEETKQL